MLRRNNVSRSVKTKKMLCGVHSNENKTRHANRKQTTKNLHKLRQSVIVTDQSQSDRLRAKDFDDEEEVDDPLFDVTDVMYQDGDVESGQVIMQTQYGPAWIERPEPPYTLRNILEQGNDAQGETITDLGYLRTTQDGSINCDVLVTNNIFVQGDDDTNFNGNSGNVLMQTSTGPRWS